MKFDVRSDYQKLFLNSCQLQHFIQYNLCSRCWVDPMMDSPPCDPNDPPAEGDTGLLDLPEDCLGLVLDLLDPVTVAILERVSRSLHTMIQVASETTLIRELNCYNTGTPILEKSPHTTGSQTSLSISQVKKYIFLYHSF